MKDFYKGLLFNYSRKEKVVKRVKKEVVLSRFDILPNGQGFHFRGGCDSGRYYKMQEQIIEGRRVNATTKSGNKKILVENHETIQVVS